MTNMNNHRPPEPAFGFSLADIYFIIFRHKRAILLLSLLGLVAGAGYFFTKEPPFQSEAMLLIKYITEQVDRTAEGGTGQVKQATDYGQGVVTAEAKILKSFDLFSQVVTNLGAERILAKAGGGHDPTKAAMVIQSGLVVIPGQSDGVLNLVFSHPDAEMVMPILSEIIRNYLANSAKAHQGMGITEFALQDQINSLHIQISQLDEEIRNAKTNAGIVDLDQAKKGLAEGVARIQSELDRLEIEMVTSDSLAAPKKAATGDAVTNAVAEPVPKSLIARYKQVVSQLAFFQRREDDYLFKYGYLETSKLVVENRENITAAAKVKGELEDKYPTLADMVFPTVDPSVPTVPGAAPVVRDFSPARVAVLRLQLARAQAKANKLDDAEAKILELERKKQTMLGNYKNFNKMLDDEHMNEAIGSGHISNITPIQSPTPPFKNRAKFWKTIGGLVFGGLMAGLAWALLFEFYIDRTIKRPSEVESKLHIPIFLAIPAIGRSERRQLSGPERRQLGFNGGSANGGTLTPAPVEGNSALVNHALDKHYDALRDRLVTYFESINLTRKPKLVAITSAGRGAGVSTIASGLAASLSETGDGRVLLVDMNQENGSAQQFLHGKANCKLDDALSRDKRDEALVQERLYVVSEGTVSDKLSRVLPKRFAALVPQLKASDYDYIIFDMPPVSQTSVTTRLAGFMDSVMLVIESEKTDRDTVQQANALLAHTKANVTAVLNKTRQHVPLKLTHDLNAKG